MEQPNRIQEFQDEAMDLFQDNLQLWLSGQPMKNTVKDSAS
jgi:hypothetical protein